MAIQTQAPFRFADRSRRRWVGEVSVLMASLSSLRPGVPHDASCILYAGDHSFVKRESYVVYQKARVESVDKILRGVKAGQLIPHDPMESGILARICKGLEESRLTSSKVLKFYRSATGQ